MPRVVLVVLCLHPHVLDQLHWQSSKSEKAAEKQGFGYQPGGFLTGINRAGRSTQSVFNTPSHCAMKKHCEKALSVLTTGDKFADR